MGNVVKNWFWLNLGTAYKWTEFNFQVESATAFHGLPCCMLFYKYSFISGPAFSFQNSWSLVFTACCGLQLREVRAWASSCLSHSCKILASWFLCTFCLRAEDCATLSSQARLWFSHLFLPLCQWTMSALFGQTHDILERCILVTQKFHYRS